MIELYVRALGVQGALVPTPESRGTFTEDVKPGEVYRCKLFATKERSPQFHRKLFALLRILHSYQLHAYGEPLRDFESFRDWAVLSAGFFNISPDGKVIIPKSLKTSRMPPDEFERLYSALIDWGLSKFVPVGITAEDLDSEVIQTIMGFV